MTELFRVISTVKEHEGRKDVVFSWFLADGYTDDRRPDELIEGYDKLPDNLKVYPTARIAELFTAEQAQAVAAYLDQHHGGHSVQTITRVELPIASNVMGLSCIPVGGEQDFLMLSNRKDWPLPFKVHGYFDLRQHERVS